MKSTKKSMKLNRETLRHLSPDNLRSAVGGLSGMSIILCGPSETCVNCATSQNTVCPIYPTASCNSCALC